MELAHPRSEEIQNPVIYKLQQHSHYLYPEMSLRSGVCRTKTKQALKLRIAEQKLTICTENLEDAMGCYYVNANRGRASTLYFCSFLKRLLQPLGEGTM